jgi:phosphatidylinositol-3-phosphatase
MRRFVLALLVLAVVCPSSQAAVAVPNFKHVVVIVFENKDEGLVMGSRAAPTFNALARRYVRFTSYRGVSHPSLPNYIAMVSGGTQGITSDCTDCIVDAANLADSLEQAGRSWKTYAEGLPRAGFTGAWAGLYAKKHDPFVYFRDIASSPGRRKRIVPFSRLSPDLRRNALPDFALIVPNMCNSMHDCPVRTGDRWLAQMLPPLLKLPNTLVFVTFDEGLVGNHIPTLALGTAVRNGVQVTTAADHYSLLRTIENAWGLPLLGKSATTKPITGIWRRVATR